MNPSERAQSYSGENGSNADVALMRRMVETRTKRRSELCTTAGFARCIRSSCIFLGDPDEAEDVVEETFWQAWRKAGSYEPSRGAVSTACGQPADARRSIAFERKAQP